MAHAGKLPPLILASASARRRDLLKAMGRPFEVIPSAAPEIDHAALTLTAPEICRVNAARKAAAVAKDHPDALVIGADTLVYMENTRFGKPADRREAQSMLARLQGRTHHVATGVCLDHRRSGRRLVFAEITRVTFLPLTDRQIQRYLERIDPLDKAGAYAIQEHGEMIIASLAGSYSNVVGLPQERLLRELARWETAGLTCVCDPD